jgi:hypothetical protein
VGAAVGGGATITSEGNSFELLVLGNGLNQVVIAAKGAFARKETDDKNSNAADSQQGKTAGGGRGERGAKCRFVGWIG